MDDTFWKGTLSEGGIEFLPEMINFIEDLTLKGIMNSICSKNDFESVKNEFINRGFKHVWGFVCISFYQLAAKKARE